MTQCKDENKVYITFKMKLIKLLSSCFVKVDELLETYMNLFDIVVAGDESMDSVNTILLAMFEE